MATFMSSTSDAESSVEGSSMMCTVGRREEEEDVVAAAAAAAEVGAGAGAGAGVVEYLSDPDWTR